MKHIFQFFQELSRNNNREWFALHKAEYQDLRAQWIQHMNAVAAMLQPEWPELAGYDAARATYRIYRDIRFSHDKTPFKTHIGTSFAPPAFRGGHVGIYVQAGKPRTDAGVWGGIWQPDAATLRKLRKAIVDNDEEWLEIVNDIRLTAVYGTQWYGEALKTAPKGYEKDHPLIEYLRLKDIGKFSAMTAADFSGPNWPTHLAERMTPLIPLMRFITYSLTEE